MVIWSKLARADLRSIHDFIAHDSPFHAKQVVQNIREKTDILERLPKIGKKVSELDDERVREISLYSYRIIYEIRGKEVIVLGVAHKRRDLKAANIQAPA